MGNLTKKCVFVPHSAVFSKNFFFLKNTKFSSLSIPSQIWRKSSDLRKFYLKNRSPSGMRPLKFWKKLKYYVVYSCRMHDIDWINENHGIFGFLCPLQNQNKIKNVAKNMIFQDFTERFSFGVLKSLSKIMKFAFFKVKPCQICEGILHLELFFYFFWKK